MSEVVLWLRVTNLVRVPYESAPVDRLLRRTLNMCHLPVPRVDDIEIYPGEGGGVGEGPRMGVYWRWWDFEGRAHLELTEIHVDPQEDVDSRWWDEYNTLTAGHGVRGICWRTCDDGDPVPHLLAAGWAEQ